MKKRWPTGGTPALNWWRLPALDMHKGGVFFVSKVTAELRRADAEACVLCSEGMEEEGGTHRYFASAARRQRHRCQGTKIPQRKEGRFCSFLGSAP